MRFIKIGERHINIEQIVTITSDGKMYQIRMANGDCYRADMSKVNKKLIDEVLNADIQLPSERTTERVNRSLQRPAK